MPSNLLTFPAPAAHWTVKPRTYAERKAETALLVELRERLAASSYGDALTLEMIDAQIIVVRDELDTDDLYEMSDDGLGDVALNAAFDALDWLVRGDLPASDHWLGLLDEGYRSRFVN